MKRILTWVLVGAILALPLVALGAGLTVTEKKTVTMGTWKMTTARVLFDSSYPAGGEALTAATLGLNYVDFAFAMVDSIGTDVTGAGPYAVGYDVVNSTLFVNGLEPTHAVDLPAFTVLDTLSGAVETTTIYINPASLSTTIAFEEMDAATDLSTLKVRILAFGN